MEVGVADLRQRLREVLARVEQGDQVTVTRRGRPVAVVAPPSSDEREGVGDFLARWRREFGVDDWPEDDDPWADVRDPSPGRPAVEW